MCSAQFVYSSDSGDVCSEIILTPNRTHFSAYDGLHKWFRVNNVMNRNGHRIDECIASDTDTVAAERRKQLESFLDAQLDDLHLNALATNLVNGPELCEAIYKCISVTSPNARNDCETTQAGSHRTVSPIQINPGADGWNQLFKIVAISIICLLIGSPFAYLVEYVLGIRCFLPNNYLIWEATRPISDCSYCRGVNRPLILNNMTQEEFQVSSSLPMSPMFLNCYFDSVHSISAIRLFAKANHN